MKGIAHYLAAAGITGDAAGPATTALQAMLTDAQAEINAANTSAQTAQAQVQTEIRENQQARALAGAFRKVAEKAGADLSALSDSSISQERRRELADTATQQVLDFVGTASSEAQDAARILTDAGFDLDAYRKAGKDKRAELAAQFTDGVKNDRAKLRSADRDAALSELKLDPKKAGRVLGDVVLVKDKVLVKDGSGNAQEVETWGVKAADGTFSSVEKLISGAGWTMQELAPRENAGGNSNTTSTEQALGWLLNTGQSATGAASNDDPLGFLTTTNSGSSS